MTDTSKIQFEQVHARCVQVLVDAGKVEVSRVVEDLKETMWQVWQASRQAVVVELPNPNEIHDSGDYCAEAVDVVEAAGLRCEVSE